MKEKKRKKLLSDIVERELSMFLQVRTSIPSLCQERPETFRTMREMSHAVLSSDTLSSYLKDLKLAKKNGRNLLTEKYARMDNVIPPLSDNPLIGEIVTIEADWMEALKHRFPKTFRGDRTPFEIYLCSELETYSDATLALYHRDVSLALKRGENLTEERYRLLFESLGYTGIDQVEQQMTHRAS
ncbi:MAG: DUF4125 family protein [Deltaproteobacteria bacterium]|nr:DUF4125 family protein [Candidatus Zymogenaceae bacterium]